MTEALGETPLALLSGRLVTALEGAGKLGSAGERPMSDLGRPPPEKGEYQARGNVAANRARSGGSIGDEGEEEQSGDEDEAVDEVQTH